MGRARVAKDAGVRRETQGEAREGVQEEDEELRKYQDPARRLQDVLHQED